MATLNGSSLALSCPSPPSVCYFVAGATGLLALYCLLLLLFWVYSSCLADCSRGPIGLRITLVISTVAIFLVLVSASALKLRKFHGQPLEPPCSFTPTYSAEASSWVNLVLWCVVLVFQILQWKPQAYDLLEHAHPKGSSEADALFGPHLVHS